MDRSDIRCHATFRYQANQNFQIISMLNTMSAIEGVVGRMLDLSSQTVL